MTAATNPAQPDRDRLVATVDRYLLLCEQRDLDAAGECLAPGAVLIFPGGVRYTAPTGLTELVADADRRYRWVRKHRTHYDVFRDQNGDDVVVSRGTLDGESLSGRRFAGVRYQDRFVLRDGLIVDQQVWNDLAASGVLSGSDRHDRR
ncbi:MAG TPA: nuclear transport factor 2 family protein [Mycobacteriales bacterium]|nr:nuclear transport factor 2 family protein [Mycobacteriales bacterium]